MASLITRAGLQWALIRRGAAQLQTGGDWILQHPRTVQQNLRYFFFDGFFSSASDNLVGTYMVVYLLALGATQTQIGLMSSIDSLLMAAILMPGALLVERIGRRKEITVFGGGIMARLMILGLGLVPFLLHGWGLVILAIALSISRDVFGNLAYPAWMSLTGDLVPIEGRGRFFSSRMIAMSGVGMAVILIAGLVLSRVGQPGGYQGAMIVAFMIGLCSTYSFWRINDPGAPVKQPAQAVLQPLPAARQPGVLQGLGEAVRDLRTHPEFMVLLGTTFFWNLSLNVAGPFFTVYLVQHLKADAAMIGLTGISSTVATMLVQHKAGQLNDRWGARRLQMYSMLVIPIVPFMWVFATQAWHVIIINFASGLLWSAFNLASFNYVLGLTPSAQRARYSAVFQIAVMLAMAAGAALGSLVVPRWGYIAVFVLSSGGRLASGIAFARLSKEEKHPLTASEP